MKKLFIITMLCAVPGTLFAAVGLGSLSDFANSLATGVVTSLGYLFLSLAVVAFFWGIVQFIWAARQGSDGDGIKNGKQFMLWGLIALFVMFSVWGIITFVQGVFNIRGQTSITIPNVQLLGSSGASTNKTPSTLIQGTGGSQPASSGCIAPNETLGPGGTCISALCVKQGLNTACPISSTLTGYCDGSNRCVNNGRGSTSAPQNCGASATWNGSTCVANTTSNTPSNTSPLCTAQDKNGNSVAVKGPSDNVGGCINPSATQLCTTTDKDGKPVLIKSRPNDIGQCF